jgi:hypothetical protein
MINPAVEEPERVARGLVRLAQSHRQLCADFLRDHRDGMDTQEVAKFAARTNCTTKCEAERPAPPAGLFRFPLKSFSSNLASGCLRLLFLPSFGNSENSTGL